MLTNVISDCREYVDVLKSVPRGYFLTRDVLNYDIDIERIKKNITHRMPRKMPLNIHHAMNKFYSQIFGWPVRNGLFSFGVYYENLNGIDNLGYGKTYLLFPIGNFKYVYDENIFDLLEHWNDQATSEPDEFINSINYTNVGIEDIISTEFTSSRSVEIMVCCDEYYLVNVKYADELVKLIW